MNRRALTRLLLSASCACVLGMGCDRREGEGSNLNENIQRTVGDPQKSPGMLGGNSGPEVDASCCTEAGDAGATVPAADAGG